MSNGVPVDLITLAYGDPNEAVSAAELAAKAALAMGDDGRASHALRAKGLAHRGRNELDQAYEALTRAIELADGRPDLEAAARATLAGVHTLAGDLAAAHEECDRALDLAPDVDRGYPLAQKGLVHQRTGDVDAARACFAEAIPLAAAAGDEMTEANARTNRAILDGYAGRFETARLDLTTARDIYERCDQRLAAAGAAHNLGFVLGRAGRYGEALTAYETAIGEFSTLGVPTGELLLDQCEVLLAAGLAADGVALAAESERQLRAGGMAATHAEALLMLASAELLAADLTAARRYAAAAADRFNEQDRPVWAALAGLVDVEAARLSGDPTPDLVERAEEIAGRLRSAGFVAEADQSLLRAGQAAGALGDHDRARRLFEVLLADRRTAGLQNLIQRCTARALLAVNQDRPATIGRQVRLGLQAVDRLQSMVGAADLRAGLARHRVDLVSIGLRQAVETDRPHMFLRWVERSRQSDAATGGSPDRLDDPELGTALAALRSAEADRAELTRRGQADPDADRRRQRLESDVLRILRQRPSTGPGGAGRTLTVDELRSRLGPRRLVALAFLDGFVWSVVVGPEPLRIRRLATVAEVRNEVLLLRTALRRLSRHDLPTDTATATLAAVHRAGDRLRSWLLGDHLGPHGVLVHPPSELLDLPWQALRTDGDGPITVVPWIARWLRDDAAPAAEGSVALVAGPGLDHAEAEVEALRACHDPVDVTAPAAATVDSVVATMERASVVHLATHGVFRADNPMFSQIRLADGPLTVADLASLRTVPDVVVLAACDAGRHAVYPGDEAVGLATGLLDLGVRSVVTTVLPVQDEATVPIMVDLHRAIAAGRHPGDGLSPRPASAAPDPADLPSLAARLSFVVVGR